MKHKNIKQYYIIRTLFTLKNGSVLFIMKMNCSSTEVIHAEFSIESTYIK